MSVRSTYFRPLLQTIWKNFKAMLDIVDKRLFHTSQGIVRPQLICEVGKYINVWSSDVKLHQEAVY
jgi:hypothetical protein